MSSDYQFEALAPNHVEPLLQFELQNRSWFESLIEARPASFYSIDAVADHIQQTVDMAKEGRGRSFVLCHSINIIARANIKSIDNGRGEIGYRVAKSYTGQGLASYCLARLLQVAQNELGLELLQAKVLENNPASLHILQKQGFEIIAKTENFLCLHGENLAVFELQKYLK
ncbi:MAG: GNAT family N-acetyltransferase [Cellvibrionaceae bacterium]|nr:GNAT family N-acetyltransferase [Cellvibrionaceae bacterium]